MYEEGNGSIYRTGLRKVVNREPGVYFACVLTGPSCRRGKVRNSGRKGHIGLHLYGNDVCGTQQCQGPGGERN